MSPITEAEAIQPAYPCPRCMESELEPKEGCHWLYCRSCGREYDPGDMEEYYSPERQQRREEQEEAGDQKRLIQGCWNSQVNRPHASGGGDDGLSMTDDIPINEANECIVEVQVTHLSKKTRVMRFRGLDCTAYELRESMADLAKELRGK